MTTTGADRIADTTTRLPLVFNGTSSTNAVFGGVEATVRDFISLSASVRGESSSLLTSGSSTAVYPAVLASVDLMRADSTKPRGKVESFVLRGGFSRSGNDATAEVLQRLGVPTSATAATIATKVSSPETTTGFEAGTTIRMLSNRVGFDVTYYNEKSENLVLAAGTSFVNAGALTNKGIEASAFVTPLRASGYEWSVGANLGKNENSVDAVGGGAVALGPASGGVSVQARAGSPLGALVGLGYRRDAGGQLVLRNGLPLADSAAGPRVLGQSLPSWTGGLSSSLRRGGFEVSVLFDTHRGGQIFSASNRAGAVSGTLAETVNRPEGGLLIPGVDVVTGQPNAVQVSTEAYYHALGDIGERWIYDASFVKLREARMSFALPLPFISSVRAQSFRVSLIGRNLALWTNAPNIDPETALSTSTFRGAEMGQLPTAKSVGIQLSLTP